MYSPNPSINNNIWDLFRFGFKEGQDHFLLLAYLGLTYQALFLILYTYIHSLLQVMK